MYLVDLNDVKPGMRLGESIFAASGQFLLARGVELNGGYLAALHNLGYAAVFIQDADTSDIPVPQAIPPELRAKVSSDLATVFDEAARCAPELRQVSLETAHEHLKSEKFARAVKALTVSGAMHSVIQDVNALLGQVANQHVLLGLSSIKTHDNYTFQHSIDVAILGIMLGRKAGWGSERLRAFGIGCLLHDLGKVFIDPAVLNKPAQLSPQEAEVMKAHPVVGYHLIKAAAPGVGHLPPQVAYQHHERQDGSGYPRGIKGDNMLGENRPACASQRHAPGTIHDFGAMAAAADIYDAMASDRPYRRAWVPDQVMQLVLTLAGTHLNRKVVELLPAIVAPYPACSTVRVLNGRWAGFSGIVSEVFPEAMSRPRIRLLYDAGAQRIAPVDIDLRVDKDVEIRGERELVPARPATDLPKPRHGEAAAAA